MKRTIVLICVLVMPPPCALAGETGQVDRAITSAIAFLTDQIGQDGQCTGEYPSEHPRALFGVKTALCADALLSAGVDQHNPNIQRSLGWLGKAQLDGTYAIALRASAYAKWTEPTARVLLGEDVQRLVLAERKGKYTYSPDPDANDPGGYDNFNSLMGVMGVAAGAGRGIVVDQEYWQAVRTHWYSDQQVDGGWGYVVRPSRWRTGSYGSITAGGLGALYACMDNTPPPIAEKDLTERMAIASALEWIEEHFSVTENPGKDIHYYYHWLNNLSRAAMTSGYKSFGSHDWYAEGVAELLRTQKNDGSWGPGRPPGDRIEPTALALLFLSGGKQPVLANKLQYRGRWNSRPRDLANLARWMSHKFERPMNWQIMNINSSLTDWHDAPILYISGAAAIDLDPGQMDKLRTFVQQGGMIVSEAARSSTDFTLSMEKVYSRGFPDYPLTRLKENHPVFSSHFDVTGIRGLTGVDNGVRTLAIHSPRELSGAMQTSKADQQNASLKLMANVYMLATDRGAHRAEAEELWPTEATFEPAATIRITRLKYNGNYDPEPLALRRLALLMGNRHRIRLEIGGPMEIADLKADEFPIAAFTGTDAFTLSFGEKAALKQYLLAGGTLIVDAAGGSKQFSSSAQKEILLLVPGTLEKLDAKIVYGGPEKIRSVSYRRSTALAMGATRHQHRLKGLVADGRVQIVYSAYDLTAGLVGYPGYRIRGYGRDSAVAIMTNILCHIAGGKIPVDDDR